MVYVVAQLSDIHVGGPNEGSAERFSQALDEINAMTRPPDLVLLTGDNTHNSTPEEWAEVKRRLDVLTVPWDAINGNHDGKIDELAGHRSRDAGPLRMVLLDTSSEVFGSEDADWLDRALAEHPDAPTVVALHHPPFETGIWWMDCVGLDGRERVEEVVRRHPQVIKVLSGHVHRAIAMNWAHCGLWVSPSTSGAVAGDLDPQHAPAETAEPPAFSLHAFTGTSCVSHTVPVGAPAVRTALAEKDPEFIEWVAGVQATRSTEFN